MHSRVPWRLACAGQRVALQSRAFNGDWCNIADHIRGGTREESDANARLIAAAPELLAACKAWDEGFIDGEQFDAEQFRNWVNERRRMARAAIAKATNAAPAAGG